MMDLLTMADKADYTPYPNIAAFNAAKVYCGDDWRRRCELSPCRATRTELILGCKNYQLTYWYHPNYLGKTEYITDLNGEPYQYFWYNPWGENIVEQYRGHGSCSSFYRFNGKELDPETGNYYYGARYYDPKVSVWLSVFPKAHWCTFHKLDLVDPPEFGQQL